MFRINYCEPVVVCPVTGETIGHKIASPKAADKSQVAEKIKPVKSNNEGDAKPFQEKETIKQPVNENHTATITFEASKTEVSAPCPCPVSPSGPNVTSSVSSTSAHAAVQVDPNSPVSSVCSSVAAPAVKTRRVPPGGHTQALW